MLKKCFLIIKFKKKISFFITNEKKLITNLFFDFLLQKLKLKKFIIFLITK